MRLNFTKIILAVIIIFLLTKLAFAYPVKAIDEDRNFNRTVRVNTVRAEQDNIFIDVDYIEMIMDVGDTLSRPELKGCLDKYRDHETGEILNGYEIYSAKEVLHTYLLLNNAKVLICNFESETAAENFTTLNALGLKNRFNSLACRPIFNMYVKDGVVVQLVQIYLP